ncbi:MAG: caspase family protein [Chthonomonas sp.]|nr:caspase family protein [Chthonomonas sp.]
MRTALARPLLGLAALSLLAASYAQPALAPRPMAQIGEPKVRLIPMSSNNLVFDMIESKDGTRLITHDRSSSPRLWDPTTMTLLRVLGGHTESVHVVAFSGDGQRILTVGKEEARVWDAKTAVMLASVPAKEGQEFFSAAISSDGSRIAIGTSKGQLIIAETGNPLTNVTHSLGENVVQAIESFGPQGFAAVSPRGGVIVGPDKQISTQIKGGWAGPSFGMVVSKDTKSLLVTTVGEFDVNANHFQGQVAMVDTATGALVRTWPTNFAHRMAAGSSNADVFGHFLGTNEELVSAYSANGEVQLYSRSTGALVRTLKGNSDAIREIRVSADGTKVGTYSDVDEMILWDVNTAKSQEPGQEFAGPTAATFSTDGKSFWIGYQTGAIRKFNLGSNSYDERIIAATTGVRHIRFVGDGDWMLTQYESKEIGFGAKYPHRLWDLSGGDAPAVLPALRYPVQTQLGGRMLIPDFTEYNKMIGVDLGAVFPDAGARGVGVSSASDGLPDNFKQMWFSDDGKFAAVLDTDGKLGVGAMRPEDKLGDDTIVQATEPDNMIFRLQFFNDKQTVLVSDFKVGKVEKLVRYNHRTGKVVAEFGEHFGMAMHAGISADNKTVLVADNATLINYDAETGVVRYKQNLKDYGMTDSTGLRLVQGDKNAVIINYSGIVTVDVATGKSVCKIENKEYDDLDARIHPEKPWVLAVLGDKVRQVDYLTGAIVSEFRATDELKQAIYHPGGTRIATVDATDGVTFYDSQPRAETTDASKPPTMTNQRLANFVTLTDEAVATDDPDNFTWLAMDPAGRYDAVDPTRVNGAKYVLRWSGGLEPISVEQLKQQFYEPSLMAKVLGSNLEALRPVPSLESLKLYPGVKVTKSARKPTEFEISLTERDGGGIGKVRVFLNGKEIVTRDGVGYFKIDTQDYKQYLLPQSMLELGSQKSNYLEVNATNEQGTLTSPTNLTDLGVPKDLEVPDVKVYALFAGTSDYVGEDGDLTAPANDARVLGRTVKDLASQLLPGKVNVTTLVTSDPMPVNRPTRTNILAWFKDVQSKATAGDIIVVFFSGHGTSQIGEKSGYFYLTAEANPADLSELSAATATISGEDLRLALSQIPAKKQVVILDTCHSGAAQESLFAARSVPSDYQRAYESIRESTGTWVLAGSAADQLSYEASNVEHGMLTYSLLEAIDRANGEGLREAPGGELFLDVRTWLRYAAERVESLKNEVGLKAVQRPELKASPTNQSFDLGVTSPSKRGMVGLKPPKPIILLGSFSQDEEDPLNLEPMMQKEFAKSESLKYWPEVAKHPNVHRVSATYSVEGETVNVKVFVQYIDASLQRSTKATLTFTVAKKDLATLPQLIRQSAEKKVLELLGAGSSTLFTGHVF